MHGTTWENVKGWLVGLLWRNPFTRVPRPVLLAWVLLWIVTLVVAWLALDAIASGGPETALGRVVQALVAALAAWFVSNILVRRFGDVARYVQAQPVNVARRQEIREKGVELLTSLIRARDEAGEPVYDRIVVAAHSLGTIVGYDILTHLWARMNDELPLGEEDEMLQPARARLEALVSAKLGLPLPEGVSPEAWSVEAFQKAQDAAHEELVRQGHPWIVTDFVTMGSPLTHAEFLLAHDRDDLREKQARRVLPTCPPVMEFDRKSGLNHIGYRAGEVGRIGEDDRPESPRIPHHAALFAFTRWTNLYSPQLLVLKGDIVSGPVAEMFGLAGQDGQVAPGIRDVAVLEEGLVTHNNYWKLGGETGAVPGHIEQLRRALRLGSGR